MYTVCAALRSLSPHRQRHAVDIPKLPRENEDLYDQRIVRETAHYTLAGQAMIPASMFKAAIDGAAKLLKVLVPGKKGMTYQSFFTSGVSCIEGVILKERREDLLIEKSYVSSDGRRGGGKRVWRHFVTIPQWTGTTEWIVYDDIISPEIFEQHLKYSGLIVGVGMWRPMNGGNYGRFEVVHCTTSPLTV